tara:strand:+ start:196 stop:363 length:168 start_codon:yes stop_codon:yes gene_type:complete
MCRSLIARAQALALRAFRAQYHPGFYYEYISVWPEYCNAFETMSGAMSAYSEWQI